MRRQGKESERGFTRIDLAVVSGMVGVLGLLMIPALANSSMTSIGVTCQGNLRALNVAWQLYAKDGNGKLVNNFNMGEVAATVSSQTYLNWAHNILDWTGNPSNTNRALAANNKLAPYIQEGVHVYKCPSDTYLSMNQRGAGWTSRVRSYSMNGFLGPTARSGTHESYRGLNYLAGLYRQFLVASAIPHPSETLVFLDEHPDSINDGYFMNVPNQWQWLDLPGSQHAGGAGVSYADGRAEIHGWSFSSTKQPVRYGPMLIGSIPVSQRGDLQWVYQRTTVLHETVGVRKLENGQAEMFWSPASSSAVLQSSESLTTPSWSNVAAAAVSELGLTRVTTSIEESERYYRVK